MKKILRIAIIFVVIVAGFSIAKNVIAKIAVENGVGLVTGMKLSIKSLNVSLLGTYVGIDGLKLFNPKGYQDKVMADLPEIYVDYDLAKIIQGNIHLPEVRFHLEEFVVVKNENGEVNLNKLTALQKKPAEEEKAEEKPKAKGEMPPMQIDKMSLKIGRVVYKDYSKGGEPSVKEFKINLNEQYSNITNPNTLVRLIVLKVMMNTPLASLTGISVSDLSAGIGDVLGSSKEMAAEAAEKAAAQLKEVSTQAGKAKDALKDASGGLKDSAGVLDEKAGELAGSLKDSADALKEKFKLPFGKDE